MFDFHSFISSRLGPLIICLIRKAISDQQVRKEENDQFVRPSVVHSTTTVLSRVEFDDN